MPQSQLTNQPKAPREIEESAQYAGLTKHQEHNLSKARSEFLEQTRSHF